MFKFILGNISYFVIMGILAACLVLVEGRIAGKFLAIGFMSIAAGTPVTKRTRFGLIDKRYKEKSFIWWQILVGIILMAIGVLIMKINGDFSE
jgi:hypothetical protein